MLALCVESSHQRGMGHLFRALNLFAYLQRKQVAAMFLINLHQPSLEILKQRNIPFEIVPLDDLEREWEDELIRTHGITLWLNDRLDTDKKHALKVKRTGIKLVTFDDRGSGAEMADCNIAALAFEDAPRLRGKKVLHGLDYLVLNPEIATFRRIRSSAEKVVVTLGGSDTYGATVKVAEILMKTGRTATLILGPSFEHDCQLSKVAAGFPLKRNVPSLMEEFSKYDLAITGGGITPFEANASGLPCIVVANEPFEISVAKHLEQLGSSVFAGFHRTIDEQTFSRQLDIRAMSEAGLARIPMHGSENIYQALGLS